MEIAHDKIEHRRLVVLDRLAQVRVVIALQLLDEAIDHAGAEDALGLEVGTQALEATG